ncbi:MAG: sensor histidine kinase, partial [Candidatus Sericytochromatia bacterium]|nr:sensor histidine kinase [Candidatus Tanganyikabacteria bacterium]
KLLKAQDQERQRIARELHDDMTQRLAVLAVEIGSLGRTGPSNAPIQAHIEGLRKAAAQLAEDIHHFAYRLHPSLLEHLGLEAAIRDHVDDFSRRSGLKVQYLQRDVPRSLSMDVATCLYRVTQESLQNVLKHAEASEVLVRLLGTAKGIGVCIHDNGKGFDPEPDGTASRGLGLISMEERVRPFQGTFRIRSSPGKGTEVHAWVPVEDVTRET